MGKELSSGLAPSTVVAHMRQQARWARGGFEILLEGRPWSNKLLTVDQRIQYMTPGLHFLLGGANLFYLILPAIFLLFGTSALAVESSRWLAHFAPLYITTLLVSTLQMGGLRLKPALLSVATAPAHVGAFFAVLFRKESTWIVTNSSVPKGAVLELLAAQIFLVIVNLTAATVGLLTVKYQSGTMIAVVLCLAHSALLATTVAISFRDGLKLRKSATLEPELDQIFASPEGTRMSDVLEQSEPLTAPEPHKRRRLQRRSSWKQKLMMVLLVIACVAVGERRIGIVKEWGHQGGGVAVLAFDPIDVVSFEAATFVICWSRPRKTLLLVTCLRSSRFAVRARMGTLSRSSRTLWPRRQSCRTLLHVMEPRCRAARSS